MQPCQQGSKLPPALWSAQGDRIAFAAEGSQLCFWEWRAGRHSVQHLQGSFLGVTFSPNGLQVCPRHPLAPAFACFTHASRVLLVVPARGWAS